jgi:hypothetical protein
MQSSVDECRSFSSAFHKFVICGRLITRSSDEDFQVCEAAIQALAKISRSSEGAHAVGDTKILEHVASLLDFDDTRFSTLDTLSNLVFYQAIPDLDVVLQERITSFLRCPIDFFLFSKHY